MKKLLTLFAIVLAVGVSSCSKFDDSAIWDKLNEQEETLNDHEKRIAALEELCRQLNTNIDALQTLVEALEKRDYITNVSPVREDGEIVGYTISFASSDTITIYNGKDGKDGVNGQDGYTPQIGVMKDTDGIYYWTLDGEWLLDGKGNKIQANGVNGIDGTDGSNGEDGTNGVDGITPRLKIENDYWYVSYDEGSTWIELGKATGEDGSNGIDGVDGDSIFSSVTQDDEYVYFNLSDGTMITLPKHDKENIQFEDLLVKSICCKHWDTNNDGKLSYAEAAAVTDIGTVFYHTNIIAFTELRYFTGLTTIADSAFIGCSSLWKITIPDSVTSIGNNAFYNCTSLTSVTIPDSVTSIGSYAFSNCTSLTSVYITDIAAWCNISFGNIDPNPLHYAENLYLNNELVTDLIIPDSVTSIGDWAFYKYTSLTSVTIPDSVTSIGSYAFDGCSSLTSVNIGNGVTSIGYSAFSYCSGLKEFKGKFASVDGRCLVVDEKLISFAQCGLTEYTIPDGVTSIGDSAFFYCSGLTSITIPDSVTSIEAYAFSGCTSLTSVTIPDSITTIEWEAFSDCTSLTSVYCKATTPPTLGDRVFKYLNKETWGYFNIGCTIYVPAESVEAYKAASKWSAYADDIYGYDFENNSI